MVIINNLRESLSLNSEYSVFDLQVFDVYFSNMANILFKYKYTFQNLIWPQPWCEMMQFGEKILIQYMILYLFKLFV